MSSDADLTVLLLLTISFLLTVAIVCILLDELTKKRALRFDVFHRELNAFYEQHIREEGITEKHARRLYTRWRRGD